MAELTPMKRQYAEIKQQHRDCLLFFRLGDFYEMFDEDAVTASRELDLALTTFFRAEPLEHRHADKLENRWPPVCLAAAALPAIALLGQLVRLLTGAAMKTGDLIFSLGAALTLVCALLCFRLRKCFAVRKG